MLDSLVNHLKEYRVEYCLGAVVLTCAWIYWNQKKLQDKSAEPWLKVLPIAGGLAFGLNTLIQVIK